MASFSDKRYPNIQQTNALILQNRNHEAAQLKSFLNINETVANLAKANDSDLLEF